jgi:hypothetical protein
MAMVHNQDHYNNDNNPKNNGNDNRINNRIRPNNQFENINEIATTRTD